MNTAHCHLDFRGCRLAYTDCGQGPPVVFIQGTGVHGAGWEPQVRELRTRYRCLTFDNRGMGQSQPVGAKVSVLQMAKDTLTIMDACGVESAHLAGHSLGGLIAQQVALLARERVRSLALLCTLSRGAEATRLTPDLLWLGLRSRLGTRRMKRHAFLKMILPPALYAEADRDRMCAEYALLFGHDLGEFPTVLMKQMAAMKACDLTPQLSSLVGIPTLVIGAAHDRIARPAMVRALAAGIPGAELVEFSDAAHALPIHDAAAVNDLLERHFRRNDL